jgi:type II secretory pathway component PulJ
MMTNERGGGILGALRRRQGGFSVVEMMIATTLGTVLMASMFTLYYAAAASAAKEEARSAASREARMATMRLAREFRLVGLVATEDIDGDSNDINTDVSSMDYEMVITSDIDDDGNTETVRYYRDEDALMSETWEWDRDSTMWTNPVRKTLAVNVDYLMFKYYDGDDNMT